MQNQAARPRSRSTLLLRSAVVILALGELSSAAYVWYALNLDDTTSWIGMVVPEANDASQALIVPLACAGVVALALGVVNRWLWPALALLLATPVVSALWMFS